MKWGVLLATLSILAVPPNAGASTFLDPPKEVLPTPDAKAKCSKRACEIEVACPPVSSGPTYFHVLCDFAISIWAKPDGPITPDVAGYVRPDDGPLAEHSVIGADATATISTALTPDGRKVVKGALKDDKQKLKGLWVTVVFWFYIEPETGESFLVPTNTQQGALKIKLKG